MSAASFANGKARLAVLFFYNIGLQPMADPVGLSQGGSRRGAMRPGRFPFPTEDIIPKAALSAWRKLQSPSMAEMPKTRACARFSRICACRLPLPRHSSRLRAWRTAFARAKPPSTNRPSRRKATRRERMVGAAGFEPAAFCTPSKRATRLRYAPRPVSGWCSGRDSNPQGSLHMHLKHACLPISPPEQVENGM